MANPSAEGDFMLVRSATMHGLGEKLDKIADTLAKLLEATEKQHHVVADIVPPEKRSAASLIPQKKLLPHTKAPSLSTRERIRTVMASTPVSKAKPMRVVRTKKPMKQVFHQMSESYSAAPSEELSMEEEHVTGGDIGENAIDDSVNENEKEDTGDIAADFIVKKIE